VAGASYVIPAGGATLYAQWTENNIDTIAFNSDGGAAVPSVSGPDGSSIALPTDTQGIDRFNGWFTAPSGGTEVGAAGASYVIPAGGATLYAQWTLIDEVIFSPNGGVMSIGGIYGQDGSLITLPTATRANYTLVGWFTAPSGGTEVGAAGASYAIPAGGVTLYAQWTPNPGTVAFASDGGALVAAVTGTPGSSITLPTDTRAGFVFDGWFTAASGGAEVGIAGASYVIPASGATLYAQWIPDPVVSAMSTHRTPTTGGTPITITGTGFEPGAKVVVGQGSGPGKGAIPMTHVVVRSSTEITAVTGGGATAGTWGVFVVNPDGGVNQSVLQSLVIYDPLPAISHVAPHSGPVAGGTAITISGSGFQSGATVVIAQGNGAGAGAIAATNVVVVSSSKITAVTGGGAKAGTFSVFVTNPDGGVSVSSVGSLFTYQ